MKHLNEVFNEHDTKDHKFSAAFSVYFSTPTMICEIKNFDYIPNFDEHG